MLFLLWEKRGGYSLPRPRKSEQDKKQSITIVLPGWLMSWLRQQQDKPSKLIESLLLRHKEELEKKD